MPRLFIAAWPPAAVLDALDDLPRPDEAGVRYVPREQWHVTLRFLGDVQVGAAAEALGSIRFAPARAVLGPAVRRLGDRVLVAPVAGLDVLAQAVGHATAHLGPPPPDRDFVGHLTLARLRPGAMTTLDGRRIEGTFSVDRITLVESQPQPQSVRYKIEKIRHAG